MIQLMLGQGGSRKFCTIKDVFPGLDMYYIGPAKHLTTTGENLDDLAVDDLSDVCCFGKIVCYTPCSG